ncbi:DUF475 domain-containing membrane protein [Arcobacter venerupis]|uniref:DUF475 domain-containing membrane protein n=1 Tax=Arcobacter venerupis TaxID=1054033 RepID=A0AAE7E5X3_9BACT|nr:DUF475 domain-containing protein [Arcobacter venerupis]QKF68512.1 DUF475 domain-containing membrane protein [Arcobacter venerupis]RWS48184.1 hypothetical protein CKA56_15345 [Arcobacter venerupis]
MKYFRISFLLVICSLILVSYLGFIKDGITGALNLLWLTTILILMEISLSFDNAIVNASILKNWNDFWKKAFLTVGILVAVFGMRLLFPLLIVSVTTNLSLIDVFNLAMNNPDQYEKELTSHEHEVSAFGSMFLLLVFLNFLLDTERKIFWIGKFEQKIATFGKTKILSYLVAFLILCIFLFLMEDSKKYDFFISGLWGIGIYLFIHLLCFLLEKGGDNFQNLIKHGSVVGFLYLEVLDASFSFDGVIGAFAISKNILVIMIGLGTGAMFVRSLTIYLVEKETLNNYVFLEHGAHYAIGILAFIMLLSAKFHIPEALTGLIGISFILLSLYSSIKYNRIS